MANDLQDPHELVRGRIDEAVRRWADGMSLHEIRQGFEALLSYPEEGSIEPFAIGHVPSAWIRAEGIGDEHVILFCHGGGYQIGSIRSHCHLMSRLSAASGARVLGFEYRLAPEHRFPAASDDALMAYRWLLGQGVSADGIAFAGDSAGGGLAIVTAVRAREAGLPLPSSIVLLSPWLDLALRGESYDSRAAFDVFSTVPQLKAMARTYLGRNGDPLDPLASPIDADLAGLPPVLVHAGDFDITLDDAKRFVERGGAQGVEIELKVWARMYHHFQVFAELPEARQSLDEIGAFLGRHFGRGKA